MTDEMRRMKVARESRGFTARNLAALAGGRPQRRRAVHPVLRTGEPGVTPRDAVRGYTGVSTSSTSWNVRLDQRNDKLDKLDQPGGR